MVTVLCPCDAGYGGFTAYGSYDFKNCLTLCYNLPGHPAAPVTSQGGLEVPVEIVRGPRDFRDFRHLRRPYGRRIPYVT